MPPRLLNHVAKEDIEEIWKYLRTHNLGTNKYRVKVGEGVSQCLGIVGKRCLPPDLSRISWMHPYLHHLLIKFAEKYVPVSYTSIQVNCDYHCNPHKDIGNLGESYIVGFGSYLGGALCIEDMDYDIHLRGLLFNGSELQHWTKQWTGNRYTLVFHTLAPKERFRGIVPSLSNYEAIEDEGVWKIKRHSDGALFWGKQGLPHPLKGRKVGKTKN